MQFFGCPIQQNWLKYIKLLFLLLILIIWAGDLTLLHEKILKYDNLLSVHLLWMKYWGFASKMWLFLLVPLWTKSCPQNWTLHLKKSVFLGCFVCSVWWRHWFLLRTVNVCWFLTFLTLTAFESVDVLCLYLMSVVVFNVCSCSHWEPNILQMCYLFLTVYVLFVFIDNKSTLKHGWYACCYRVHLYTPTFLVRYIHLYIRYRHRSNM